jgi:putative flippase GtrA
MFLTAIFQLQTLPANVLSYSAGIANNYYWNRRWTFSYRRARGWFTQLFQFAAVSMVGLGLNSLLVIWLEDLCGLFLAKLLATGFVLLWNYNANRLWTFGLAVEAEAT